MSTARDGETPRRRAQSIARVAVVGVGWILVAAFSYFAMPLSGRLSLAAFVPYVLPGTRTESIRNCRECALVPK